MASSSAASHRHTSLYSVVTSSLTAAQVRRCEEIFAGLEIEADGHRYRVGHIIKAAWQAEDALPAKAAREVADLVRAVLDGSIASYALPACCSWHRLTAPAAFDHPDVYPDDRELLANLCQLLWTLLPQLRGTLLMRCSTLRQPLTSRFMVFESFIKWHDREAIVGGRSEADAMRDYADKFRPSRNSALRRADLRNRIAAGEICGMIGARNDNHGVGVPHYCDQRRPFSTPSRPGSAARSDPPDRELSRLGLQFGSGQRFIELLYHVEISPRRLGWGNAPALPTIVDSEGYWLFRPDRAVARDGLRWNYARNLETDGRGSRELIARPSPMRQLTDLIVWPRTTTGSWADAAASALGADNLVP